MISSDPIWTHQPKHRDPAHFDAFLHSGNVTGSWFRATLDSAVSWDRTNRHANRIIGISDGILIATHYRKRGCHAFEIESGKLIWSYPKWKFWNKTYPVQQTPDTILCSGGEHLDSKTGALKERTQTPGNPENEQPKWVTDHLTLTTSWKRDPVRCSQRSDLVRLIVGSNETEQPNELAHELGLKHHAPLGLRCDYESGWEFSFHDLPYAWQFGISNVCFNHPYVYTVIPESQNLIPSGPFVESTPTTYRFIALNCQTGRVDQDIALGDDWCGCTIEDIDDTHILFSFWRWNGWNADCFVSLHSLAATIAR